MSVDRVLLARYLRQLTELGVDELVLEELTAREAMDVLAGRRSATPAGAVPRASASASPQSDEGTGHAQAHAQAHGWTAGPGDVPAEAPALPTAAPTVPAAGPPAVATPEALSVLQAAAGVCTGCGLHATRTSVVFGEGDPAADVVVVGEAPGQEEDRTGRPFVGRAGKLLDLLLMTAGFPREKVYICNVLKCRPPNNRNPQVDEVSACTTSFLHGQLDAIRPKVLLAVGKFAAQALLGSDESISRLRGVKHSYRDTPLIVTYHPAYLLRSPQMTRVAWQDYQLLRKVLHEQARS
jgi:uracil-DNA glycosylase